MTARDARRLHASRPGASWGASWWSARAVGRAVLGLGLFAGLATLTAPGARADDCASLQDCFRTASTAAQVAAGLAIVVAAAALALPALLRGSRGPSELHEAGVDEAADQAQDSGPAGARGSGSGAQAQNAPRQGGQTQSSSGGAASGSSASGSSASGSSASGSSASANAGLNLPNLPDTPDVPLTPEAAGMMGAQEAEAAGATEGERAREYTPQALDQMRALGLSAADVEAAIRDGRASRGSAPGTTVYSSRGLVALVEATSGRVLSVTRV